VPADDDRLRVVTMDAGRWLSHEAAPQSVQLLHVDLYDHEAAAPVLDDEAFYAGCHAVLADGGVMSVNLFGRDASLVRSCERIAGVFGADQVWTLQPTREGNTVVVAARGVVVPGREELLARAETIEQRFGDCGLAARKWLRCVRPGVPASG
jgi:spermidine synthase